MTDTVLLLLLQCDTRDENGEAKRWGVVVVHADQKMANHTTTTMAAAVHTKIDIKFHMETASFRYFGAHVYAHSWMRTVLSTS